MYILIISVRF